MNKLKIKVITLDVDPESGIGLSAIRMTPEGYELKSVHRKGRKAKVTYARTEAGK